MLHNLEILNGEMSPNFEENNLKYTVFIKNEINNLEITYDTDEDILVNIIGNENIQVGENIVYLELTKEGKVINTYTLEVTKEEAYVVSKTIMETTNIAVKEELPSYVAPLIGGICFILILFSFLIIFHKKKR